MFILPWESIRRRRRHLWPLHPAFRGRCKLFCRYSSLEELEVKILDIGHLCLEVAFC